MNKLFKKISLLTLAAALMFFTSCNENDDAMNPYQDFEPEAFGDLTTELLQSIETPYHSAISSANSGGRITSDISASALMESILNGAKVLDVSLEEERGLQVIEIELKMPSGGILEVYVLSDLSRILEMEGVRGPFDYAIDPQGSFIALADALQAAQAEISGEMIRWELELEEDDIWEYEVHLRQNNGEIFEVEINAFTSEVISVKQFDVDDRENYDEYFKGGDDDQVPTNIVSQALAILNGTVIYTDYDDDDYEIYIETSSGAVVEFDYEDNELEEMEGERGPFDYDFTVDGLISFSEALNTALNEVDGTLVEWDLDLDDDLYFTFDILLDGKTYEVAIDAVSGQVLEVDEDDDDKDDYDD